MQQINGDVYLKTRNGNNVNKLDWEETGDDPKMTTYLT